MLVDDIEAISRRWSVKLVKVGAALSAGWLALTAAGLTASVPAWVPQMIGGVIFVGAILASYLKQPEKRDKCETPNE